MKRRTFLHLTGMAAAGSALAGCRKGNEKLIPFLVPPEDGVTPGLSDYYASACRQCPGGCGILVKVSSGRARKVEGNPHHPVNRGKLCARGQALVQELYHPDRLRGPLKRSGNRGEGSFQQVSWEEALTLLTEKLSETQGLSGKHATLLTARLQGYQAELASNFERAHGNLQHLSWETLHPEWQSRSFLEGHGLLDYDLENAQYLLSFGADFLEGSPSPVRYGQAFGRMRQGRPTVRGRFCYVGPRLSMTAASADRWLPARSGTEWTLAMAMARELLRQPDRNEASLSSFGLDTRALVRMLEPYSIPQVAEWTGVGAADIEAAVQEVVTIRPALAMVGEMSTWQANGHEAMRAVDLLNLLLGNLNRPGGIFLRTGERAPALTTSKNLLAEIERMHSGDTGTLLVYGNNPVYGLPPSLRFLEALDQVPFIASFASFLDDTAKHADLILPDHVTLESWGEVIPKVGVRSPTIGLMQPVVQPLYDTRPFPELLIALTGALAHRGDERGPQTSFLEGLQQRHAGGDLSRWNQLLAQGGVFPDEPAPPRVPKKVELVLPKAPDPPGQATGLQLQIYPSPVFHDGSGALLPWLQQLPDPMTTAVWGSWLEINPATAARLGITQGDLVEVRSAAGVMTLPAVLYPGIRPELVACPLGQGHSGFGRYADGRGRNPLSLAVARDDQELPGLGVIPVEVRALGQKGELVTAGHPDGSYRRELLGI